MNGTSSVSGDCDDLDPFTYPGVAQLDSTTLCLRDLDGDGYGDDSPANSSISAGTDCDDAQAAISSTTEIADGQDQNYDSYEDCFVDRFRWIRFFSNDEFSILIVVGLFQIMMMIVMTLMQIRFQVRLSTIHLQLVQSMLIKMDMVG